MSSTLFGDFCEDHLSSVNISQTSEDLFEESHETVNNSFKSHVKRIISPQGNSSETSEELLFIHRRKPRKSLSISNDSSTCYSKKNCGSLNASSSKFFRPISPECEVDAPFSSNFLEVKQSNSVKAFKSNDFSNLSKENVEVISCIPESDHTDSSSILESSNSERENKSSKKSFKTPVFNSVKKRTICQWLSNISLDCSVEPVGKGIDCKQAFIPLELPISGNQSPEAHDSIQQNVSQIINSSACIPSSIFIEDGCDKIFNKSKLEAINGSKTRSLCHTFELSRNNSTVNYCPWLFEENEKPSNGTLPSKNGMCNSNSSLHYSYHEIKGCKLNDSCNKSFTKCIDLNSQGVLGEQQEHNNDQLLDNSVSNISKRDRHLARFNNSSFCYKADDDNYSSANESDFTYFQTYLKKEIKAVDSDDDSFIHARSSKKKKNCLNVSSDDSEAKDTANDSEDIPNHNVDPYTPKRRLYFRNPLNNSLDDDAEPVAHGSAKKINANAGINSSGKCLVKNEDLIDQICSEVLSVSKTNKKKLSVEKQDVSSDSLESSFIKGAVDSIPAVQNNCFSDEELSSPNVHTNANEFSDSVVGTKSNASDNLNQLNFSVDEPVSNSNSVDIIDNGWHNVTKNSFETISPSKEAGETFPLSKSCNSDGNNESSPVRNAGMDESWDSMVHFKRKSKRNLINDSIEESFEANKVKSNIIDVGEICDDDLSPKKVYATPAGIISHKIKAHVNLVSSDDEFDKYIYRKRSDSSSSMSQDSSVLHKDSMEDVISIHTTTEDEGQNEDDNAPWFDLELYLKKNIPASSKSLDSSFFYNLSKRKAQLTKIVLPSHSNCSEHTSFLLSLTSEVPNEMCHQEAVKYRDSFSKHKNELVDLLFKLYNKEIFDDKLPPLEIKWSGHLTTTSGITKSSSKITKSGKMRTSSIKLSKTVVDNAAKLRDVLLHELCHAANWLIDEQAGGHGPLFKKWVNKIWMKFPEIPKVKTTHRYELKWKYLYKCTFCGYELGKMKLSLNENSCRLCGGLVTVNA